jgi:protein-arginine kinase activator protein McsA
VPGQLLTAEGLVAAIAELTAAKDAAVAEEDYEKAAFYKGQISQYQATLKVGIGTMPS